MHPTTLNRTVTPWYKQRWPWFLMLGPAIVVVGSMFTAYLAFSTPDPVVVGDYYKQGKAINQDLRRDRVASAMGLSMTLGYDPGRGMLTGQVLRNAGAGNSSSTSSSDSNTGSNSNRNGRGFTEPMRLRLAHATLPDKDIEATLQPDAAGRFAVPLAMLERSRWVVQVEGEQRDWRLAGAWVWPKQRAVTLVADVAPVTVAASLPVRP